MPIDVLEENASEPAEEIFENGTPLIATGYVHNAL